MLDRVGGVMMDRKSFNAVIRVMGESAERESGFALPRADVGLAVIAGCSAVGWIDRRYPHTLLDIPLDHLHIIDIISSDFSVSVTAVSAVCICCHSVDAKERRYF